MPFFYVVLINVHVMEAKLLMIKQNTFVSHRRAILCGESLELCQATERSSGLVGKARAPRDVEKLELGAAVAQETERRGVEPRAAHHTQLAQGTEGLARATANFHRSDEVRPLVSGVGRGVGKSTVGG